MPVKQTMSSTAIAQVSTAIAQVSTAIAQDKHEIMNTQEIDQASQAQLRFYLRRLARYGLVKYKNPDSRQAFSGFLNGRGGRSVESLRLVAKEREYGI